MRLSRFAAGLKFSFDQFTEEPNIQTIKTIGLDIAKSVFQVHGIDAAGSVTVRCQLKRRYVLAFFEKLAPCLIGIEACASGGTRCLIPPNRGRQG